MSRYKIATKTDTLRYKIAKEVFGEIEDSDGVRDIPSWEIFQKCLEQHHSISTLEKQLSDSEAQNKRVLEKLELLVRSNQELEKALELACRNTYCELCPLAIQCDDDSDNCEKSLPKWYIEQSQKELKKDE